MKVKYIQKEMMFRAVAVGLQTNKRKWADFKTGQPVDLDDKIAEYLIARGYCEAVKNVKNEVIKDE